jgi:putative transposase
MIDRAEGLSVVRQCRLLEVARATAYYTAAGVTQADLELMRRIDEVHLKHPFYGSRRIRDWLEDQGRQVNRKKLQRLMRQMGLVALYPRRKTSQPGAGHTIYPYRLRGLAIDRVNQVWAADICYLPMAQGFLYLVAVMDWHSRRVLAWRLSNTLDCHFCVEALEEALSRYGTPEIFNTDQGAQFTAAAFTEVLKAAGVTISMDGKGRWVDNVFVERLWRSVKYEEVYLKAYENARQAQAGLDRYFRFYNGERRHQALGRRTPDDVYFSGLNMPYAA